MLGIKIDKSGAISEITKGRDRINSDLMNLKENYKKMSNVLTESKGEFVDSIKTQIYAEGIAVDALIDMLNEFYNTLEKTVMGFEEHDSKLKIGIEFNIKNIIG